MTARHLLHGEIGDGAEVAAGEALGGRGEGGVGLDAERCGLAVKFVRSRAWHHDLSCYPWAMALLPVLRRPVLR